MSAKRLISRLLTAILFISVVGSLRINTSIVSAEPSAPTAEIVTFSPPAQTKSESTTTIIITAQLDFPATAIITVPFTVDGTATVSDDYTITTSPLTIDIGNNSADITITVVNDSLDESDETVIVTMGTPTNATPGSPSVSTATIQDDDDPPIVDFNTASQAELESVSTMTISAVLSGPSGLPVTVPFSVGGTATPTTDYSITSSPIIISAGSTSADITITVVNDSLDESDETVIVTMGTPTNATPGSPSVSTATIQDDDDPPIVDFNTASQAELESVSTMTISAVLSGPSGLPVTVPFSVGGTATPTTDYSITSSPIIISAGSTSADITITVVNDSLDESDETVIVTMGTPTNATPGSPSVSTATIQDDDDPPIVDFNTASQAELESVSTMTISAVLSGPSGLPVTVPFSVGGTATPTTDYSITSSPITISAGNTSADITITVVNDSLDESDETVIVTMGTPTNASKGITNISSATILDNDLLPAVSFTASASSGAEDIGQIIVSAQLSSPSGLDVTVPFTLGGTATLTTDFTILPDTQLIIPAGNPSANIAITVIDDLINEIDETVILTMGIPINATQGITIVSTATILDNDLMPTVDFVDNSLIENGGVLLIFAQLNTISSLDVTVPFTISGGNATPTDDYLGSSIPIVIPAGSTTASTSITVVDDFIYENDETIILTMGTPTNAAQGLITSATATIVDDEQLTGLGDFYEVKHSGRLTIPKTGFPGLLNNDPIDSNVSLTLEVSFGGEPTQGTLDYLNDDGSFRYTPDSGYVGPDSFQYIITNTANNDQSASIIVTINVFDPNSPHVVWEFPVENGMQYEVRCEDITLDVDASDDISVDYVVLSYFDYVTEKEVDIEILNEQPYTTTFSTCGLNPAFNQINAIAFDNSGNDSGYPAFIWLYRYAYTVFLPSLNK